MAAVAHHQAAAVLVPLAGVRGDVCGDLGLQRLGQKMEEGPVTGSYGKDPNKDVIAVLNEVVATEIVC